MESSKMVGMNTVLFKEGEAANKLYVVKEGEVICLKSSKDRLIPIFLAKKGDIIGEAAMIQDLSYTYSAISLTPATELIEISSFSFKQVFSKTPDWLLNLTISMISRFQSTSGHLAENRIIHPSIISNDEFEPKREVEFKKLLSQ